jgi:RNA polymerase sigma factor (sigma-70 family)
MPRRFFAGCSPSRARLIYDARVEDDLSLLQRWRDGDPSAGSGLLERHFAGLYRFFVGKVTRDVDDLIQQTFLACVEGRDRFRGEGRASFRAYLYGIARNLLYGHYRSRSNERFDAVVTSLEDLAPSPSQLIDGAAQERVLAAALRRIPVDAQVLLELHYWEGLTHQELAEVMDLSLGVIKGRIQRAKDLLRAKVAELDALGPGALGGSVADLDRWVAASARPAPIVAGR